MNYPAAGCEASNTEKQSNKSVIPHLMRNPDCLFFWIPASAGMTSKI
jgi:hypothetical protein